MSREHSRECEGDGAPNCAKACCISISCGVDSMAIHSLFCVAARIASVHAPRRSLSEGGRARRRHSVHARTRERPPAESFAVWAYSTGTAAHPTSDAQLRVSLVARAVMPRQKSNVEALRTVVFVEALSKVRLLAAGAPFSLLPRSAAFCN